MTSGEPAAAELADVALDPPRLYAIADADALGRTTLAEGAAAMAEAGVRWIQLRGKGLDDRELCLQVEETCRRLEASAARLWVNDRVDLAAVFPVAGVHLGQDDLPPEAARRVLGPGRWIGVSTHDLDQVAAAERDGAVDAIAVGPVFETVSKPEAGPAAGLDFVRRARGVTGRPLVAIGGIDADNAARVLAAGADTVAVLGAACRAPIRASCRALLAATK